MTINTDQLQSLYKAVKELYASVDDLPFHGWHHVEFVYEKSAIFADDLGADKSLAQAAALVHDLNYLVNAAEFASEAGRDMRADLLMKSSISAETIKKIQQIVHTADGLVRDEKLELEAKALSDADTLFKSLPVTPILFASRFLVQTNYNIRKLTDKIINEQGPLLEKDIYFYSQKAKSLYGDWAQTNLTLWKNVRASFNDPSIIKMLEQAGVNCAE